MSLRPLADILYKRDFMPDKTTAETIKKIKAYAAGVLSKSRYEHSLRTAKMARALCERFSLDRQLGFLAGVSHDLCKQFSDEALIALAKKDGFAISALEGQKPSLLHGRAAAELIQESFGVTEESVLDAVRWHTFGRKGLCPLGRVLFVADKIEPGRKGVTEERRKALLKLDFNELVINVIEDNIAYLNGTGKITAPETLEMLEELREGQ